MAKKFIAVSFLITMIIFSSISIYAAQEKTKKVIIEDESRQVMSVMSTAVQDSSRAASEVIKERREAEKKEQQQRYLNGLSAYIRHINGNVSKTEADVMAESFVKYAEKYNVDEKIVMAVAQNESTYYSDAVSCENFKGLMQTGDGLAENAGYSPSELFNPEISIKVGSKYLSAKIDEFGDIRLALTAYNQGSGSVHSGNYSTGYADLAINRAEAVEAFLQTNGYQ